MNILFFLFFFSDIGYVHCPVFFSFFLQLNYYNYKYINPNYHLITKKKLDLLKYYSC
ncbi:hypothetical protein GLOIN_2v1670820 [Rhizophagus irregularis DAOM 181602=DAOM 197198]|uniref:Uncharacterized protein n=1 Tax=Rhizophagus irregularis (strain DAOM 181602 / DAOM 197198 / MUCL 43194) TaxID=747089 RepID=A0A2P4PHT1_RHIID|nr:hypothetical protein GLOIN_2v1670820 [Rhizophagus irregularis DAOM 181602=DAOM 197198]POG64943.1 hypothetical protein GLOIN_2v1670820 [Rhizophagus irregularis DAOM 181602=DAOM 197198]|eukprot:XP_025171809.1 hypothetical protein GLOIN_2v1670820 [Rhizophagus irregularis DAOM 181602=DAOM 197198]